jgi:molybdopterin/thiamine biosynthesis adenylyltransferase
MNPVIFVYESQLRHVLSNSGDSLSRAVAFEWPGEDVYHVHTDFPQVAPSGYPNPAFVKVIKDPVQFEECASMFGELASSFPENTLLPSRGIIGIFLYLDEDRLRQKAFRKRGNEQAVCEVKFVPEKTVLYARSKGLLEVEALSGKKVLLIGLGSFGSVIALELAKAGIGHFTLVDFDRVELGNISRHVCGVNELGRFKTRAIRDAVHLKNPYARVNTHEVDINENRELLSEWIDAADLVICATDNNRSRFNINELAHLHHKTVLYGRALTRAEGGDVFIQRGKTGPCYCCLIGEDNGARLGEEEITSMEQAEDVLPAYTTAEQKEAAIQVGLSSDILPMCNMMVKLALVELSKGLRGGLEALENELTYGYYFWANRRERQYGNFAPFNRSQGQPTVLKWYGVHIPTSPDCFLCSLTGE